MKKPLPIFLLLGCLALGGASLADLGTIDAVPAATLLVPYFAVDLDACGYSGQTTVMSVTNTSSLPTVAHVTLWTDHSVPLLVFDVYLEGFDVQPIDLADIFCLGALPVTAIDPVSRPPTGFLSCGALLPPAALDSAALSRLRNGFTGQPLPDDPSLCASSDQGDNVARGYVTVDTVNDCNILDPTAPAYVTTTLAHENRLMGDYGIFEPGVGLRSFLAVHVEADPSGTVFANGERTFYGRYVGGDASDRREPLPSVFAASFSLGASDTVLYVWREGGSVSQPTACVSPPPALEQSDLLVFNQSEDPLLLPVVLPLETNRLALSATDLPFTAGWVRLDERHGALSGLFGDDLAQAWVSVAVEYPGGSVSTVDAHQLPVTPDPLLEVVFLDGFETGSTTSWSSCNGCP